MQKPNNRRNIDMIFPHIHCISAHMPLSPCATQVLQWQGKFAFAAAVTALTNVQGHSKVKSALADALAGTL